MTTIQRQGILFILAGPSGSGKTTVGEHLLEQFDSLSLSISSTTRAPRENEIPGVSYNFLSREEFQAGIDAGDFFEYEEVHGNFYGTPLQRLDEAIGSGQDLFLAIDINGALTVKKSYPANTVLTFILPPSTEELVQRVSQRSVLEQSELDRRLETAKQEYQLLLDLAGDPSKVDYIIINDLLEDTCRIARSIVDAERRRLHRLHYDDLRKVCSISGS